MVVLLAIAWIAASTMLAPARAEPAVAGRALIVTDIHFNPMADPALVDRLAAADPRDWPGIFASARDRSLGHYLADTNWRLLRATLRQMKAVLPDPAVVLIPGDFLAHQFRRKFNAAARHHSDADYRAFVYKTMQFLTDQITGAFPGRPILPVIGNNDSDCGDYQVAPGGPFLAGTLPLLRRMLGGAAGEDVGRDWRGGGNYSVVLPHSRGLRVIVVNTVFFSPAYRNRCGSAGQDDPGKATLAWLAHRLEAARQAGVKIWLTYHIPPGDDFYETFRSGKCPKAFVPLWKSAYAEPFYALMRQYAGIIAAAFAGHLHMDTFRLIPSGGFVLITPAVSPIFGQNPAFRTVSFDRAGRLLDETTYDLTNLMGANASPTGPPADWEAEYTFTREWHLPRLDRASLARLAQQITTVPDARRRWEKYYTVSSPASILLRIGLAGDLTDALLCAPAHLLPQDFDRCYCGAKSR
ncbi:MAG TPA: hypothetical protein VJ770_18035 [Stellaceae bacterium]|nr:hypothetical protein [Stellaceae bacterium]